MKKILVVSDSHKHNEILNKIFEANKDIDMSTMYKEKVVRIQPKKRITKQLDIESIGKEKDSGN